MTLHPDIEGALQEVARETGQPYQMVERVFRLSLEASDRSFFTSSKGDLTAVSSDDSVRGDFLGHPCRVLPASLMTEINAN